MMKTKQLWRKIRKAAKAWIEGLLAPAPQAQDRDCYGEGWEGAAAQVESPESQVESSGQGEPFSSSTLQPCNSSSIVWLYGGVDGSRAVEDPETQIRNLRMDANGLRYDWAKGGCENFGAASETDYGSTLACAFFWDEAGRRWIGGKFDWISTSRTSRSFENVRAGYHGWDPEAFFHAKRHAFCILSANGKRRTNLIEA